MPAAARLVALNHLDASAIVGTGLGGRIMRYDVVNYMESAKGAEKTQQSQSKPASVSAPSKKAAKPIVAPISGGSVNYVDEPVLDENKSKMEMDQLIKKTVPHSYLKNDLIVAFSFFSYVVNRYVAANQNALSDDKYSPHSHRFCCKGNSQCARARTIASCSISICFSHTECGCQRLCLCQRLSCQVFHYFQCGRFSPLIRRCAKDEHSRHSLDDRGIAHFHHSSSAWHRDCLRAGQRPKCRRHPLHPPGTRHRDHWPPCQVCVGW